MSVNMTFSIDEDLKKQAENDEDVYGPFDSIEELMEALNS